MTDPHDLGVLEALHSTPARRYLSTEPIPDDVLWELLDAAVRAPSGGNHQGWGWVVVTDQAVKDAVAVWYREGWQKMYGVRRDELIDGPAADSGLAPASYRAAEHLAEHLQDAPVWVVAVLEESAAARNPRLGASIYGAVQHLMLAARAYGIGSTLTTLHIGHEDEVKELLGIPADAMTMAIVPLGYPEKGRWAQPKRRPLEDVVHWERWGDRRPRP